MAAYLYIRFGAHSFLEYYFHGLFALFGGFFYGAATLSDWSFRLSNGIFVFL